MRRSPVLVPVALFLGACSATEATNPLGGDAGHPVVDAGGYQGPSTATIGDTDAKVVLRLEPFGMRIENAAGTVLIDTFDGDSKVAGDDAHAYGALGATYHEPPSAPRAQYGWDREQGTDSPWRHATRVAAASFTATGASIDLFDPADEDTTFHLDIAVDGAEVRVDATINAESAADDGDADAGIGPLNQMGQSFVAPGGRALLRPRRAARHRRPPRHPLRVLGRGGRHRPGRGRRRRGPTTPAPNGPGMTHVPVPFYISDARLRPVRRDDLSHRLLARRRRPRRSTASTPRSRASATTCSSTTTRRTRSPHYTALTGRARLPAPWVFGPRRRVDRGTHGERRARVAGAPRRRTCRPPWSTTRPTSSPSGREVGQERASPPYNDGVHALGFKSIAYYNPYVSVTDPTRRRSRRLRPGARLLRQDRRRHGVRHRRDLRRRAGRWRPSISRTPPPSPGTAPSSSARSTSATTAGCSTSASTSRRTR